MLDQQTADRASAAGAAEEANAAIGACLCTAEPTGDIATLLRSVQDALTDIATAIDTPRAPRIGNHAAQLDDRLRDHENALTTGSLVARLSLAAGLLRLARTITQRAARSVAALGDNDLRSAVDYLSMLPRVLDGLADELDNAEEDSIPLGTCV